MYFDPLFKFIEQPLIWLSHRRAKSPIKATTELSHLGVEVNGEFPFSLLPNDLSRHAYILGSTGCGKTSLIMQLIEQDLLREHSIVVVDLRGDLVEGILGLCDMLDVEPSRVTLLDLREKERVQGFNPLAGAGESYIRALHVLDVVAAEAESWGVQLEETMRSALLVLAESGEPLTRLESLFYDVAFRAECLARVTDASVCGFWDRYAELSPDRQQTWALPVLNKITSLLAVPVLRKVLGSAKGLDLGSVLNHKGSVLLISLAVDELQRSSRMLGSLVVSAIAREMLGRVTVPEAKRNPVRLYVDEFENMASTSFEGLIAEGRRFKLSLVLSHQTLAQLPAKLRSVVRNNVGLQLIFQCGFEDAKQILFEMPKGVELADIRSLGVGQAMVMRRDGEITTVQFRKPRPPKPEAAVRAYRSLVLPQVAAIADLDNAKSTTADRANWEDWLCD